MNTYKSLMNKLTGFVTPIWTIVSIVAGIIYIAYLTTSWMHSREDIDRNLNHRILIVEKNQLISEKNQHEMHDAIIATSSQIKQISEQQKLMLVLLRRRGQEDEMVD